MRGHSKTRKRTTHKERQKAGHTEKQTHRKSQHQYCTQERKSLNLPLLASDHYFTTYLACSLRYGSISATNLIPHTPNTGFIWVHRPALAITHTASVCPPGEEESWCRLFCVSVVAVAAWLPSIARQGIGRSVGRSVANSLLVQWWCCKIIRRCFTHHKKSSFAWLIRLVGNRLFPRLGLFEVMNVGHTKLDKQDQRVERSCTKTGALCMRPSFER